MYIMHIISEALLPVVLRVGKILFYFYSNEHLPAHIHVRYAERRAKFDLRTGRLISNSGFGSKDISLISKLIINENDYLMEAWLAYFKEKST